jgi:hypothetical protein
MTSLIAILGLLALVILIAWIISRVASRRDGPTLVEQAQQREAQRQAGETPLPIVEAETYGSAAPGITVIFYILGAVSVAASFVVVAFLPTTLGPAGFVSGLFGALLLFGIGFGLHRLDQIAIELRIQREDKQQ